MSGYPILLHYKYLGIEIDDSLKLDIESQKKKQKTKDLKKKTFILTTDKLNGSTRFCIW